MQLLTDALEELTVEKKRVLASRIDAENGKLRNEFKKMRQKCRQSIAAGTTPSSDIKDDILATNVVNEIRWSRGEEYLVECKAKRSAFGNILLGVIQ